MSASVTVRVAIAVVALLAAGWLALSLRTGDLNAEGAAVVNSPQGEISPAAARRGIAALRDARLLNADKDPFVNEVILLSASNRIDEANVLAERLVGDEPENADAWFVLWVAALAAQDSERAEQAINTLRELNPLRGNVLRRLDSRAGS